MILSMTGFARREIQGHFGTLSCELRSLNHRYLELSMRMPEELRQAENAVREKIQGQLRRGKIDATLRWTPPVCPQTIRVGRAVREGLPPATLPCLRLPNRGFLLDPVSSSRFLLASCCTPHVFLSRPLCPVHLDLLLSPFSSLSRSAE